MEKVGAVAWENFRSMLKPLESEDLLRSIFNEAFTSGFVNGIDFERERRLAQHKRWLRVQRIIKRANKKGRLKCSGSGSVSSFGSSTL
jgi:hypothetical protein